MNNQIGLLSRCTKAQGTIGTTPHVLHITRHRRIATSCLSKYVFPLVPFTRHQVIYCLSFRRCFNVTHLVFQALCEQVQRWVCCLHCYWAVVPSAPYQKNDRYVLVVWAGGGGSNYNLLSTFTHKPHAARYDDCCQKGLCPSLHYSSGMSFLKKLNEQYFVFMFVSYFF